MQSNNSVNININPNGDSGTSILQPTTGNQTSTTCGDGDCSLKNYCDGLPSLVPYDVTTHMRDTDDYSIVIHDRTSGPFDNLHLDMSLNTFKVNFCRKYTVINKN